VACGFRRSIRNTTSRRTRTGTEPPMYSSTPEK
jgi:hypothetical protein